MPHSYVISEHVNLVKHFIHHSNCPTDLMGIVIIFYFGPGGHKTYTALVIRPSIIAHAAHERECEHVSGSVSACAGVRAKINRRMTKADLFP